MRDDFSLARPAGHLIMEDGSGPDGLAKRDGAKALFGAESGDTATTPLNKPPRTKNLITESYELEALYDGTMDSSFWYTPHKQLFKCQTAIGKAFKHRW